MLFAGPYNKVSAFLGLAALTLLFAFLYDPYQEVGPELLENHDFRDGLRSWQVETEGGSVLLRHPGMVRLQAEVSGKYIGLTQIVRQPVRFELLRLVGEMRTEKVVPGPRDWQQARLILSSHDRDGRWLPAPHHVALLRGAHGWRPYDRVFKIIPAAEQLRVTAQLPKATGTLWVKNLSLRGVVEKKSHIYLQTGFLILWGMFLAWLLVPYVTNGRTVGLRVLLFACFFGVLMGTLTPGMHKIKWQRNSAHLIQKLIEAPGDAAYSVSAGKQLQDKKGERRLFGLLQNFTKSGHFVLFALLGIAVPLILPAVTGRFMWGDLAMLAGTTELMQFYIQGRSPMFGDFVIDITGISFGLMIVVFCKKKLCGKPQGLN